MILSIIISYDVVNDDDFSLWLEAVSISLLVSILALMPFKPAYYFAMYNQTINFKF